MDIPGLVRALGEGAPRKAVMELRQVALVAQDLEPTLACLGKTLGLGQAFADPGVGMFGLENGVMPLGRHFLEVVAPKESGTTAGRLLEKRGGDGGYMAIFQVADLARERKRVVEHEGFPVAWETDLGDAATIHLHPRGVGAAIVSLDWMDPPEAWRWGGPDWPKHPGEGLVTGIHGIHVDASDPADIAARWGRVLGEPVTRAADGAPCIRIGAPGSGTSQEVTFTAAGPRGDGISGLSFFTNDRDAILERARNGNLTLTRDKTGFAAAGVTVELVETA